MCTPTPEPDALILDVQNACLWRKTERIPLKPKETAVLHYLTTRPNQLVHKAELLQSVWPETFVSDTVLRNAIRSLRLTLGDSAQAPQYIETKPRQGYRLIGPITAQKRPDAQLDSTAVMSSATYPPWLVGRDIAMQHLHTWLDASSQSKRCVGVITGEIGIGKTTLVETFLTGIRRPDTRLVLRGQCVEQYGMGEAYLPLFEALYRECRGAHRQTVVSLLRQYAPSWLLHMPGVLPSDDYEALARLHAGASSARMMREFVEVLDALSLVQPVIFVVEDLHWSDTATLTLLGLLAQRREPARVLLLLTYRPEDIYTPDHPLQAAQLNWQRLPHVHVLPLTEISAADTVAYLAARCSATPALEPLAHALYQRTTGNPLFLATIVDHLIDQQILHQDATDWSLRENWETQLEAVPPTIRDIIVYRQGKCVPDTQQVLTTASVAGMTFSSATIAAALQMDIILIETLCDQLVQYGFLLEQGETNWADGTLATRYGFRHALYQAVLYNQISAARRAQLHRAIGQRLETGYDHRVQEIAAQLARHFECGQDFSRAVHYHHLAAQNAIQKSGFTEALHHANTGLILMPQVTETSDRTENTLRLYLIRGTALQTLKGYASTDVEHTYARARELSLHVGDIQLQFQALQGLFTFHLVRGIIRHTHDLSQQIHVLAQSTPTLQHLPESILPLGLTSFFLCDMTTAIRHLTQATQQYHPQQHRPHAFLYGQDPGIYARSYHAMALWHLGYPDQARQKNREALALAQEQLHPYSLAMALNFAAVLHHLHRDWLNTQHHAEALIQLATEQGFQQWLSCGLLYQGWALAQQGRPAEGLDQIHQGLADRQRAGSGLAQPYLLSILAETYAQEDRLTEGLHVLDNALTHLNQHGERWWEPELYRLTGELLQRGLSSSQPVNTVELKAFPALHDACPESWFQRALKSAQRQQARSLELRAAMSLSRWWQHQDETDKAYQLLGPVYDDFTEGHGTSDLQEARDLLMLLDDSLKQKR